MSNGTLGGIAQACFADRVERELTEQEVETVARAAHEANRGFCFAHGDLSQSPWELAPAWQRESAIAGVKYHIANPFSDERASHDQWMERKLREGWRYGPTKDAEAKVHPCLLPFHALSPSDKVKDTVFRAIVNGYAQAILSAIPTPETKAATP